METIRVKNKNVYELEVNDKGETIVFDLSDITLPRKLGDAYKKIGEIQNNLKAQILIIEKRKESKKKNSLLTNNQLAITAAWEKAYADMRNAMDLFLGEGGCQKIFGDSNYVEMFDDLFEALSEKKDDGKSVFDHLKVANDKYISQLEQKYGQMKKDANTTI